MSCSPLLGSRVMWSGWWLSGGSYLEAWNTRHREIFQLAAVGLSLCLSLVSIDQSGVRKSPTITVSVLTFCVQ